MYRKKEVFENDFLRVENIINMAGYRVFGGLVWTVENATRTLVWAKNVSSVFKKQKTELFENTLVWTGP